MARQWERVDEDTAVGPRFGQEPLPSFSAPTLAYFCRQWKRDLRLRQHHCRRTDDVDRFCDSSKAIVGLQQILLWTMRWCDPEADPRQLLHVQRFGTAEGRPTSLGRGSQCITRGRRYLPGWRDEDDRTRWSDRHSTCLLHNGRWPGDDGGRERSASDTICRLDQRFDILDTVPFGEKLNVAPKARGFVGSRRGAGGREQEDNATTKGTIDVQGGLETAQKGSSPWQGRRRPFSE